MGRVREVMARVAIVATMLAPSAAFAEATLVQDLNVTPTGTGGSTPVAAGGTLFFVGTDEAHGTELWKTDGTEAGTVLVKDAVPGPDGTSPMWLINAGGLLYFVAGEWGVALELWRSDGTADGTVFLATLNPGYDGMFYPDFFTAVGTTVFFGALDADGWQMQLWRSDGTPEGTGIVKEITPIEEWSELGSFLAAGDLLYFTVNDGEHGTELWRSDGTAAGTVIVRDVRAGPIGSGAAAFGVMGGTVYFTADDGVAGSELWRTDGTATGTTLVADIQPGPGSSYPYGNGPWVYPYSNGTLALNGVLFFNANDGVHGSELWRTDGTTAGTFMLADMNPGFYGASPQSLFLWHDRLFFSVFSEIWTSNGTPAGTTRITYLDAAMTNRTVGAFTEIDGTMFFLARNPYPLRAELWKTDGTAAGTVQLVGLAPPLLDLSDTFTGFDGKLFFTARDAEHATELWTTDGTATGTRLVRDLLTANASGAPGVVGQIGDAVLFTGTTGTSSGIWRTDGAAEPTLIANVGAAVYGPPDFTTITMPWGILFDGGTRELWRTDGTAAGTMLVKDINPQGPSIPHTFVRLDATTALFTAYTAAHGYQVWRTDGTAAGTRMVREITAGSPHSIPEELRPVGGRVFFAAEDRTSGRELWWTDGTADGTTLLDLVPGTTNGYPRGSHPSDLTELDGALLFTAWIPPSNRRELWRSDGTVAGTVRVADVEAHGSGSRRPLIVVDGKAYFRAETAAAGLELWRTDGTTGGTAMVVDLTPGPASTDMAPMVALGSTVFLVVDDGVLGWELWRTDGTAAGTALVRDIAVGPTSSSPQNFLAAEDRIYFTADDGVHGREVWTSDGTAAGTTLVRDWKPGASGGSRPLADFDGTLLVAADDGHVGVELWAVPPCGDGERDPFERCDDGNASADDCCMPSCLPAAAGRACGDDMNPCTDDACDGAGTCAHVGNAAPCDDGAFCNGADACSGGTCAAHIGDPCPGQDGDDDCTESCSEETRDCSAPDPAGAACDDGVFCNGTDTCDAQTCSAHTGDPCPGADGDADCRESCDEAAGACTADDAPGAACTDGLYCSVADACDDGICRGVSRDCSADLDQCHLGVCDEATDQCIGPAKPDESPCDDGDACTFADACSAGTCGGTLDPTTCVAAFRCRKGKVAPGTPTFAPVGDLMLDNGLERGTFVARTLEGVCAPAVHAGTTPPSDPALVSYRLASAARHVRRHLAVTDLTGTMPLLTLKAERLLVRSTSGSTSDSTPLSGYACYRVKPLARTAAMTLALHDEIGGSSLVTLKRPRHVCVPVARIPLSLAPPREGWLCWLAKSATADDAVGAAMSLANEFGSLRITNGKTAEVCLPALLEEL